MAFSTIGLLIVHVFLYLGTGSFWSTKYFKYSYILVNEIICEDLTKITQIVEEIWTHVFLWISLKIAKLHYKHYYYFCILEDVATNYHPIKFDNICKTQCWNMGRTFISKPKTGPQFKDGFRRQNKLEYILY